MLGQRIVAGLVSGLVALLPPGIIAVLTATELMDAATAAPLALVALLLSVVLAGGLAGWLAGRGRRLRRESKAVVGATAGIASGLVVGLALESALWIRAALTPPILRTDVISQHPLRVTAAVILLSTLVVALAMVTCQLTARPLPPPRPSRRLTGQLPALPRSDR